MTWFRRFVVVFALVLAGCGTHEPALPPASDNDKIHDLLVGPGRDEFLSGLSSYAWPDGGARAGKLFDWIVPDSASANTAVASRAGQTAHALAAFLGSHESALLNISTGWLGMKHRTLGALNPKLTQSYASALIPFQRALACDPTAPSGFAQLDKSCAAAIPTARSVFILINTDGKAAKIFTDAAYGNMDSLIKRFAQGLIDPTNHFDEGPRIAGTLLGLVHAGADQSKVDAPTVQSEENRANYLTASIVIPRGTNPGLPPEYFSNGQLMSPDEISHQIGPHALAGYYASLALYLRNVDSAESRISTDLRRAYWAASKGA
jgi:hypothetical protein